MKIKSKKIFSLAIVIINLIGCNIVAPQDSIIGMIDVSYLSSSKIASGQSLSFIITNKSKYCITFPAGYNLKIFANIEGEWIEINNLARVWGNKPNILKPGGNIDSVGIIDALPDISSYSFLNSIQAFVLISGQLCNDENFRIEKKIPFTIIP